MTAAAASRHVLFIAYYYPPSTEAGAKRALGFHRFLGEWGYRSTLVTIEPGTESPDIERGVVRVRRPGYRQNLAKVAPSTSVARRRLANLYHEYFDIPDGYGSFFGPACAAGREIASRDPVDAIVVSSSPYTALRIGSALSRQLRAPWIADLRDLWTANHFGYPYGRFRWMVDRWLERRWLKTAGRVVTATRGLAEKLSRGGLAFPGATVLNGFLDAGAYERPSRGPFRISFLGRLYESAEHTPLPFFEALSAMRLAFPETYAGLRVDFFGWVNQEFQDLRARMGLEDVVNYGGQVSGERAQELARAADLLLVLLPDKPSQSVTVPTKLFDYAATGRPILFIGPEGEGAQLVREASLGRAFRSADLGAITDWIIELAAAKSHGEDRVWGEPREVSGFHYRWRAKSLAAELDTLLSDTAGRRA